MRPIDDLRAVSGWVTAFGDLIDDPDGSSWMERILKINLLLDKAGYRLHPPDCKVPATISVDEEFGGPVVELAVDADADRIRRHLDPDCERWKYMRKPGWSKAFGIANSSFDEEAIARLFALFRTTREDVARAGRWHGWVHFWALVDVLRESR